MTNIGQKQRAIQVYLRLQRRNCIYGVGQISQKPFRVGAFIRSRFVRIVQTWSGDMPQEYFKAGVVFQVCQNCADLERVVFLYSGICSIIP